SLQHCFVHSSQLLHAGEGEAELWAVVVKCLCHGHGGYDVSTLFREEAGRLGSNKRGMFDAAHAERSGAADSNVRMSVGKDVKTTNVGFLHGRKDFGVSELQLVDGVSRTGNPA